VKDASRTRTRPSRAGLGRMLRPMALGAATVLAAGLILAAGSPASAAPRGKALTPAEIEARIATYKKAHPNDLVGLDKFQQTLGASPTWYLPAGATAPISASAAQALLDSAGQMGPTAVPVDAFTVGISGTWYASSSQWRIAGSWNFRDNYVNGSDPDDVSELTADPSMCINKAMSTFFYIYNYTGTQQTSNWYLYDSGVSHPTTVVRINDGVSGFVTNFDHGEHVTYFGKASSGCSSNRVRAAYKYEHNQDYSSNSISISVAWNFLSISYSGSGGSSLQKSSQVFDHS
jgi:hypothetical protein